MLVQYIQPTISNLSYCSVRLGQCFTIEEEFEDLCLEDLDEFEFSSPLHFEPFQFC